jgi:hypothetical protein
VHARRGFQVCGHFDNPFIDSFGNSCESDRFDFVGFKDLPFTHGGLARS